MLHEQGCWKELKQFPRDWFLAQRERLSCQSVFPSAWGLLGQMQVSILPYRWSQRHLPFLNETREKSGNGHEQPFISMSPAKRYQMAPVCSARFEGYISSSSKEKRMVFPYLKRSIDKKKLDPSVFLRFEKFHDQCEGIGLGPLNDCVEERFSSLKIYRTAIVGIYQPEVPKVGSLIEIGDSGSSDFEKRLGKGIENSVPGYLPLKGQKSLEKSILF